MLLTIYGLGRSCPRMIFYILKGDNLTHQKTGVGRSLNARAVRSNRCLTSFFALELAARKIALGNLLGDIPSLF